MSAFPFIQHSQSTAFLFPGQGSQHVGMAQELANSYAVAKAVFTEADEILRFPLSKLCFEGPETALTDTLNAQPALLTASVAILRAIQYELQQNRDRVSTGVPGGQTTYVAGHSMGEYSALVAAGCLSFADGLRLVRERGRLMKAAGDTTPGMMAAVLGMDETKVATICTEAAAQGGIVQVANDNCPGQVVISGDKQGMETAIAGLTAAGAKKVTVLAISIPAHSPLMQPAAQELNAAVDAAPIAPPLVPVIANTTAQPLTTVAAIRAELAAQLTGGVRWTSSMHYALAAGVTTFVEVGPGEALTGIMKRIDRNVTRLTINSPESVKIFAQSWLGAA